MKYLVTLTPLKPFFFGGEKTFSITKDKKVNYFAKSRFFPQQTAILGMIRKTLLLQNNLLKIKRQGEWVDNKKVATKLVGDTKFNFYKEIDLGVVDKISPVFIINDKKYIQKVAIDKYSFNGEYLEGYNPKEDIYNNFISIDNTQCLKIENIFKQIEQIGISKKDKEDAYFKKISYELKDNFKFAFYVEFNRDDFEFRDDIISLGGERSTFKMEISPTNEWLEYRDKNGYTTLISDCYINLPIRDYSDFAITSDITFKYLENEFRNKKRVFKKSKNINLYQKGSVFIYPKEDLINHINSFKHLQKIGLNII